MPINTHANEPDFRSDVSTDVSTVAAEIYSLDSIGVKDLAHTHILLVLNAGNGGGMGE